MPVGSTYRINGWAGEQVGFNGKLTVETCPNCHIIYAIPEEVVNRLRQFSSGSYPHNYASTYCPNGHRWHFTGKNDEAILRERLEQTEHELRLTRTQRDKEKHRASALKGKITRIKNRIAAGICPVCKANLGDRVRDHIGHEHPEFTAPDGE